VRVHNGDTSLIEVDAYIERKFKGIVTEIANSANTTGVTAEQVTNFTVKIRILQESYADLMNENNVAPFRPGMSATVDIQTKTANNVLTVPIQSVTTRADSSAFKGKENKEGENAGEDEEGEDGIVIKDEKNKSDESSKPQVKIEECVFIMNDGKAKLVKVKTGIQDNNYIEVKQGLKEGDQVVSGPYSAISKTLKEGSAIKQVDKNELFSGGKK
jgi:HlyD family secretion protein